MSHRPAGVLMPEEPCLNLHLFSLFTNMWLVVFTWGMPGDPHSTRFPLSFLRSVSFSLSLAHSLSVFLSFQLFLALIFYLPLSHPYSPMYSIPGLSWPSLHPSLQRPVIMLRLTQRCSVQPSCCCLICSVGALIITHLLILGSVYRDCRHVGPRPDTHTTHSQHKCETTDCRSSGIIYSNLISPNQILFNMMPKMM